MDPLPISHPFYDRKPETFIFTLTNLHSIPLTRYGVKSQNLIFIDKFVFGPAFGSNDICVSNNSNQNNLSFFGFQIRTSIQPEKEIKYSLERKISVPKKLKFLVLNNKFLIIFIFKPIKFFISLK